MTHDDYAEEVIDAVWEKGQVVPGVDPSKRRKDCCGAWIDRDQFGVMEQNGTGWKIDDISLDLGDDELTGLQPIQWENQLAKMAWIDGLAAGRIHPGAWFCVREARV